jgi:NADH-quinone oxidoreductase subunit M
VTRSSFGVGAFLAATLAFVGVARAQDAPRLEISPASLSFGEPGEERTLTLRNAGGAPLHVGPISFVVAGGRGSSEFRVDTFGARELPPGQTLDVAVSYRPVGAEPRPTFAALLVPADDPRLPLDLAARDGTPSARRLATVALRARESHLLTTLVLLPLLGALALALVGAERRRLARVLAAVAASGPVALAALALAAFDPARSVAESGFGAQLVSHRLLSHALGVEYFVGVDGWSLALVASTTLLGAAAVASAREPDGAAAPPRRVAAMLLTQGGASGVLVALDGFLLWVFWLLAIAGVAALASQAAPRAPGRRAPPAFLVALFAGAAILLLAVWALHARSPATYLCDGSPAPHTFDLLKIANATEGEGPASSRLAGRAFAGVAFWGLFAAFALTAPLFPVSAWPAALVGRAPAGASSLLTGVPPLLAIYGFLRLALPLAPEGALDAATLVALLGALGAVRAALLARDATDVRGFLAQAASLRVALCLVGVARATTAGLEGAMAGIVASALAGALAFAVADAALPRGATLAELEGLSARAPRAAALLSFALFASLSAPGLATFVGPALVVLDVFGRLPAVAILALVALAVSTGAHARLLRRVLSPPAADAAPARELDRRALAVALPLAALVVALGVAPAALLDLSASSVRDLVRLLASSRG